MNNDGDPDEALRRESGWLFLVLLTFAFIIDVILVGVLAYFTPPCERAEFHVGSDAVASVSGTYCKNRIPFLR